MFTSLINRTILWELCKIFTMSLVGITGLLLLAVVVIEAQNQGLSPLQILTLIPLVIPSTLPYTIPATTLFATCIVYGRLAHDNEILAIRAAGINILQVVWPAAFMGLFMSITTAALFHTVIPTTYHMMKSCFMNDIENVLYTMLKREGRFCHPASDYVMYVKRVEGHKLIKPLFLHRDKKGLHYDIVAEAREAELRVDQANNTILLHMRHCNIAGNDNDSYLEDKIWPIDIPPGLDGESDRKYRRSDMVWDDLLTRIDVLQEDLTEIDHKIALAASNHVLGLPPNLLAQHLQDLRNQKRFLQQQIRDLRVEIQRRPSLSFGCLCFVLVGCPIGIWFSRSDYLSAFVTCFLPIVFIYYPLALCGENLAKGGSISPIIGLWGPNVLMAVVAVGLYKRLLKH